jgi:hypothetical protein
VLEQIPFEKDVVGADVGTVIIWSYDRRVKL